MKTFRVEKDGRVYCRETSILAAVIHDPALIEILVVFGSPDVVHRRRDVLPPMPTAWDPGKECSTGDGSRGDWRKRSPKGQVVGNGTADGRYSA